MGTSYNAAMRKALRQIIFLLLIVLLMVSPSLSQTDNHPKVKFIVSNQMQLSINLIGIYKTYDSDKVIHKIDYSLANQSDRYIGMVSFVQYELSENNEEISTSVWHESDEFQLSPFETKHLSASDDSIDSETTKLIWSVYSVCTDKGTWSIDLKDLKKAIFPYRNGKKVIFSTVQFDDKRKCLPE
jgi:hypothetical protein